MNTTGPTGNPTEFALAFGETEEPDEASDRSPDPVEEPPPQFVDHATPVFPSFAEPSAQQAPAA